MKAVILAAGEGKRMGPLTQTQPKAMLPIANKPILEHVLLSAYNSGIREYIFVVGYHSEKIKEYFGDGSKFGVRMEYLSQEKQLGTAHAIGKVQGKVKERFLILNGDIIVEAGSIKKLIASQEEGVIAAFRLGRNYQKPKDFGIIEVNNERVSRVLEKPTNPPSDLANAGLYVFGSSIFDAIHSTPISPRGEYEITDSIQLLINKGKRIGYVVLDSWLDIGYPWNLLDANEIILSKIKLDIQGEVEPYATIKGNVFIGKNTIVRNGAYIIGPVVIGKDCDIGPNCFIRPSTSIGDGVRIGNGVEIKNSIIMKDTHIGHLSYVGDSVIGERCNFGAGTKVANLRHDGRNILVKIKGKLVDSGRRKLGTIMGDDVHTGINSMINVGTTIEAGATILPGEFIKGSRGKEK